MRSPAATPSRNWWWKLLSDNELDVYRAIRYCAQELRKTFHFVETAQLLPVQLELCTHE